MVLLLFREDSLETKQTAGSDWLAIFFCRGEILFEHIVRHGSLALPSGGLIVINSQVRQFQMLIVSG